MTPAIEESAPTPEVAAIISDLHWLIHEGHVIEFANGMLEAAKAPAPRPPTPPRPEVKHTGADSEPTATTGEEPAAANAAEMPAIAAEATKPDSEMPAAAISPVPSEPPPEPPSLDPAPPAAGA